MDDLHPRIRTALVSVNPTSRNPAWHGAPTALGVLRGVNHRVAVWRPYPAANNIREIMLHIVFWENSVANRLSGEHVRVGFSQRAQPGWPVAQDGIGAVQWRSEVKLLKETRGRLVDALVSFDPAKLDEPPAKRIKRPMVEFVHGVGEHSLHHVTQIDMIKKLARHQGIT